MSISPFENYQAVTFPSIFSIIFLLFSGCNSNLDEVVVASPNNINTMRILIDDGKLFYQVNHQKKAIVLSSRLGFIFKDGLSLSDGFKIKNTQFSRVDETWEQPWGSVKTIRNNYEEAIISFSSLSDSRKLWI